MFRIVFINFILILLNFISFSNARLVVREWHQENNFTDIGQEITVRLKLTAKDLPKNYYHGNWTYVFDKKSDITVIEYKVLNDDKAKIEVKDNKLSFNFKNTFNDESVFIEFKYVLKNDDFEKSKFIRREGIFIPSFAKGAIASILVVPYVDNNTEIYSNNELFQKDENGNFLWVGNVPLSGFRDFFDITMKEATWEVSSVLNINDDNKIGDLSIKGPLYFFGGGNTIKEFKMSNSQFNQIDNENLKYDDDYVYTKFDNYDETKAFFRTDAVISNTYSNFIWANDLDPNKGIEVDAELSYMLNTIINQIKEEDTSDIPLYAKIAKWVNKNIQYDISFYGKELDSKKILEYKKGVCIHYSILYRDMLRSINIPAFAISGIAYDLEKKTFESHSWVLVNHNNMWIPIDPTWNIYSGKLPISHIFMYKNVNTNFNFLKTGSLDKFRVEIKNDVKLLH